VYERHARCRYCVTNWGDVGAVGRVAYPRVLRGAMLSMTSGERSSSWRWWRVQSLVKPLQTAASWGWRKLGLSFLFQSAVVLIKHGVPVPARLLAACACLSGLPLSRGPNCEILIGSLAVASAGGRVVSH